MTQIEGEIRYSPSTAEALAIDAFDAGQITSSQETSILYMIAIGNGSSGGSASGGNSGSSFIANGLGAAASVLDDLDDAFDDF